MMIGPDHFDVILPAITAPGAASPVYAALTLCPRTASLLRDVVEQQRQSPIHTADDQYAAARTIGMITGHLPRFYQPQPGYRDIELELALADVVVHGYAITRWEDRDGRVPVHHETVQITPFGLVWEGTAFDTAAPAADPAVHRPDSPTLVGQIRTGVLSLALLRRIADGTIALRGREPIW